MMKNSRFFLSFIFLFSAILGSAQHQELQEKTTLWKPKQPHHPADSSTLWSAFHHGTFHGHFRNFLMATDNAPGLSDYFAEALGGGIKFETGSFHNFKFGMSGFVVFNIHSSNLSLTDHLSNQSNRYEIGLFDLENPHNKNDIDRLEELYIKYSFRNGQLVAGRQLINSTFINLQDGRMRPTEVQGLTLDWMPAPKTLLQFAVLDEISPRSTVRWFRVGRSIGIYAQGVNAEGVKNEYEHNIKSEYVAFASITQSIGNRLKIQVLDQYVDRLYNSGFVQADLTLFKDSLNRLSLGGQAVRQDVMDDHAYFDPERRYLPENGKSWIFGGRVVYGFRTHELSLNYTRITAQGQYIMPREWGRDPFFTFLSRERNEGLADVHAMVVKYKFSPKKHKLKTTLAYGHYQLPDVKDFEKNKYGLPSYFQLMADVRYEFEGPFKGFDAQILYVYKGNLGETYDNYKFVINKVNMSQYNFVINYHF